ncbi:glycosyltransferase family 2 protein [Clostridium neonatale]|uniref:glycosyltransferase family 2 protein n=1 Tax=Clostridium neonatale TaxID=137838 RepID=UPI00291B3964|nr:Glyco_trans_2-like domain-containing protein [Clostridium neonatale]
MKISIVIPCYNEEKNIKLILEEFKKISFGDYELELILVNNGSKDNSKNVLEEMKQYYDFLKVVEVVENKGYGYGILEGLKQANGEYMGWMHADMQTSPNEFCKCIKFIGKDKNIFIKGLRKNRPISDTIFTLGMSVFETVYLRKKLYDINAQPTLFSRKLYEKFENPPYDFSLDLYVYYKAIEVGNKIVRFPVIQKERIYGTSSWNTGFKSRIKLIKRVISYSKLLKSNLRR